MAGCLLAGAASAAGSSDRIEFDIAEQPLSSALETFSRISRVQVLYESDLAFGLRSRGASGRFTPEAALEMLISGTDLRIRFTRDDAVVLMRPSAGTLLEPPLAPLGGAADLVLKPLRVEADEGDDERFRTYAGLLRADIEKALKQDTRTKGGRYSAGLKLWVDQHRAVRRTELVRSSGDRERDATIFRILQGLVVSEAPPPRMPNPIHVAITVRTL
ncbi:Outer membrane receptor for ferric coprogen and ferric-rhodotorulic acid [Blastochloris viridis]|uniref:Outer membrane receptor for ferric coprogen and ferric-rhodotorulic acid n=1 Tax=Blastochloris viridis TaxID=1079 RepID=A0A0S4Q2C6_BLAVI|nr:Outer membrane receptor for ferric coprogen and ferric-rhodotorulic acid [Blastochloris viridis]